MKIDLGRVVNHPDDPFKPYADDKLRGLADSIAEFGLLEPICVREIGGGEYQILAGKNRANAARLLGMDAIEAFVFDAGELPDDETLVRMIYQFLAEKFGARGKATIKKVSAKRF